MSSLSFDSLFPSEAGNTSEKRSEQAPGVAAAAVADLPARWSDPLADVYAESRTVSEASTWMMSPTRRALEFIVSLLALMILLPLMAAAALLVRFGSDGPVLFRQRRMGRKGREFTLYKFRSMRIEGECGSCITVVGDSRITPVGAFLRRYKLDEVPQFWNVLRGDMSLVGPRPKLPHHEALHMESRPGITGVATLAFRREEELLATIPEQELETYYEAHIKPAKARMDMEYIRTATLVSDFSILWRTATSCLFGMQEPLEHLEKIVAAAGPECQPAKVVSRARPVASFRPDHKVQEPCLGPEL